MLCLRWYQRIGLILSHKSPQKVGPGPPCLALVSAKFTSLGSTFSKIALHHSMENEALTLPATQIALCIHALRSCGFMEDLADSKRLCHFKNILEGAKDIQSLSCKALRANSRPFLGFQPILVRNWTSLGFTAGVSQTLLGTTGRGHLARRLAQASLESGLRAQFFSYEPTTYDGNHSAEIV